MVTVLFFNLCERLEFEKKSLIPLYLVYWCQDGESDKDKELKLGRSLKCTFSS